MKKMQTSEDEDCELTSKDVFNKILYRTKTYIAADWSGDYDAVEQLHKWNISNYWSLSFTDAHDLMQARDSSLNCSIKASLSKRLDASKTFVLIVGLIRKQCVAEVASIVPSYNSYTYRCARGHNVDYRSYVEYECEKAVRDGLKIVVLYNAASANKSKCPDIVKNIGTHVAMCFYRNGQYYWDYQAVRNAIG